MTEYIPIASPEEPDSGEESNAAVTLGTTNITTPDVRHVTARKVIILRLLPPSENFGANAFAIVSITTANIIVVCNVDMLPI